MKKVPLLATAGLTTLVAFGALAGTVYAWHPQGTISKQVQNQTAGGALSEANDAGSAVTAAPGDTLNYSITISNTGAAADNGNNDMAKTQLTDTLPSGLQLVSDPSKTTITEDLGTIAPGKTVTKTYAVKVTDTKDGDIITNKACFAGNSMVSDSPQTGCDIAVVKVVVPPVVTPPTATPPATTPTPTTSTPAPTTAEALPNTGSTAMTATLAMFGVAGVGYTLNMLRLARRMN
jgi:uncharacterized repeat protein (TIGR01451 family)